MGEMRKGRRERKAGPYPAGIRYRLRSAAEVARLTGVWRFTSRVLPWSLARDYSIFSQDLESIVPPPPPLVPFRVQPAGKDDIPAILRLRPGYYSRTLLEKRLEAGHLGFIGRVEADPVYCHWALIGTIEVPYLHGRLVLGPGEALTDEIFVDPVVRRRGIYAYGSGEIRTTLRARGFRTIYSAVASWNDVPRRVMIMSGMTEIARLRCRNIPGFMRVRWSGRVEVHEDGSFAFHARS
jgi:hypothetical protein